jgi:hypothetical protein
MPRFGSRAGSNQEHNDTTSARMAHEWRIKLLTSTIVMEMDDRGTSEG